MRIRNVVVTVFVPVVLAVAFVIPGSAQQGAAARTGTITGRVKLAGNAPGNPVVRMGADPVCAALARASGKLPVQPIVVTDGKGNLANAFVSLQGTFPAAPAAPADAVTIVQRTCEYEPRVVGMRVGQPLKIVNADTTLHNLHSQSTKNPFNVTQPKSGMVFTYTPKTADAMLRLTCDVHNWMHGYIAVVAHPYFAVSKADGSFTIANVPPGKYAVKTWHERFGEKTSTVTVTAGGTATLDVSYNAAAAPRAATVRVENVAIPATN
jgi:plastocyanin